MLIDLIDRTILPESLTSMDRASVYSFPSRQHSLIELESKSVDQSDETPYLYQAAVLSCFLYGISRHPMP